MALTKAVATVQASVDAETALLDGGTIQLRTGVRPAAPSDAATGTLVATLTFGSPAFGSANGSGVATANAVTPGTGVATGTPTWARLLTSGAAVWGDCDAGVADADLILSAAEVVQGAAVSVSSLTHTNAAS